MPVRRRADFRSTDGGTTWTPLLDNAMSLAIGAIAIAPSQPDTIYVGTGEPNFSADCFFGVGIYRITNASTASPVVSGPFNKNGANADVFTGTSVGKIAVDPTNPDNIFVATTFGIGGIGGGFPSPIPALGIFRCTNATTASPVFTKLSGVGSNNRLNITDVVVDPGDPNRVVVAASDPFGVGGAGIYLTTNALAATPMFGLTQAVTGTDRVELDYKPSWRDNCRFCCDRRRQRKGLSLVNGRRELPRKSPTVTAADNVFIMSPLLLIRETPTAFIWVARVPPPRLRFQQTASSFTNSESGLHTDFRT